MQIPPILQQLGRNQFQNPMMAKIKQMFQTVKMAQNPQMMMNQMIQNNPQMKQAMEFVRTSGKTPEQAFYALANQMGVDPREVLNSLK